MVRVVKFSLNNNVAFCVTKGMVAPLIVVERENPVISFRDATRAGKLKKFLQLFKNN